ncbi:MAG: hypothetical protein KBE19_13515, partial [Rhodocyclaceae bacterium]|nr:hypothetical protein [Rhodocyclaceae bacterium]
MGKGVVGMAELCHGEWDTIDPMISDRLFTIREEGDAVLILDQTLLPHRHATRHLNTLADAAHA